MSEAADRNTGTGDSADVFSPAKRSEVMSRVRSKNTKPEIMVRSALHAMGYRFRLHRADLPGKPDIVLPGRRVAMFVHGCFWHQHPGCGKATLPKRNADWWREKLQGNVERDARNQELLREIGWRPVVIWECEVGRAGDRLPDLLEEILRRALIDAGGTT